MARRVARTRFVRPPQKTKIWIGDGVGVSTLAGAATTLISTLSAAALLLRPFTVLRSRLELLWLSDQEAADENPFGTYGSIVVTENAAAIGITALPNPSGITGDADSLWFIWQALAMQIVVGTAETDGGLGRLFTIDSKSMRKVGPNDDIATLVDVEGAQGARLISNGRQLIQLH